MSATLVLMAAGFGTRFGGGVKQMTPVGPNGEALMEYAIHDALAARFDRVIFIIRKDLEREFRDGVGKRVEKKCEVAYAFQRLDDLPDGMIKTPGREKPWGTAQAVLACRDLLHGPFCVLNADDYYGPHAFRMIYDDITAPHTETGMRLCMAGYVLGNTLSPNGAVTRGVCQVDADGFLTEIDETRGIELKNGAPVANGRALDSDATVSMNIWGMQPDFLDYLREGFAQFLRTLRPGDVTSECLLPEMVGQMLREGRGRVKVLRTDDKWFGMTYAVDKLETQRCIREMIAAGAYPEKL